MTRPARLPRVGWAALLLAGGAGAAAFLVPYLENHLIFWPLRPLRGTPADRGLEFEELAIEPAPGAVIRGWYIPHPSPRAVVLYLEGNGANRSWRLGHITMLHELGCSVVMVDYEGYGDSSGKPHEEVVYRDARAARAWVQSHPETGKLPLVLHGESLGGAVAIELASAEPPRALIVDHSFTSMTEIIDRTCRGLPLSRFCKSRYSSIEKIPRYQGPLLVIHGDKDALIPIAHGRRLFEAANEPKTFLELPGVGHHFDEFLTIGGDSYRNGIHQFLDESVGPVAAAQRA